MHDPSTRASYVETPQRTSGRLAMMGYERFMAPLAALFYPFWLDGFHFCIERLKIASAVSAAMLFPSALALLALAVATPAIAGLAAARLARAELKSTAQLRAARVAFLAVAAVPIYTFIGVLCYMASVSALDKWIVSALWIVAIVLVAAPGDERLSSRALPASSRPRLTHRVLGVAITIFVLAHVANHLFGLVGPSAYMGVMKALRHVYRFPFLEPALPLIFLSTAASGGFLAWRASARRMDGLRAFQLASGIYLFFYIVSHLNAVFVLARSYLKIDSDWDFATGAPMGLIQDPWSARLIPHYAWAVFFALGHVFAAIRTNLLARGASRAWADGMLFWGSASGALITLLILLGMCGLRLSLV